MKKVILLVFVPIIVLGFVIYSHHIHTDLIVGTNPTFPPLEYIGGSSGRDIIGPNVELVGMIAKDYGEGFQLSVVDFVDIFTALDSGKIDLSIGGLAITEERKKLADFSDPYYSVSVIALVRDDDNTFEGINTKEELGVHKRLGTRNGSVLELTTRNIADGNTFLTKGSWKLIVDELLSGKIDAVIINNIVAEVFITKYGNLVALPIEFETLHHGIAVKKGNVKLLNSINKTIAEVKASGVYEKLVEEHIQIYANTLIPSQ